MAVKKEIPELKAIIDGLMEIINSYNAGGETIKLALIGAAKDMYISREKHNVKELENG